ncbi:hydrolase [Vibrio sp. 10N.286.49.B3]|uniref:DUF3413 domain-containing protein n=1 Tax=Vibrio sp. 10N.286.49.B3 TaxID=1880855 RepID=UPI000C85EF5E|nr:DUF3413 domain-containing protein [Vibrio sp. 10N.286.49.B3]PMH40603.1 hydrolase [Vibrio sp. 10N.286.49.B3]
MVDSENTYSERVSRLVGWGHWFAFFNIIAAMLIGTRYITESPWPESLLGQLYLALSWVGHFGFLVFVLYLLVLFPLTFILPSRKLLRLVAVCFATVGLTVLLIDTQAYQSINLHLTPVVWELLFGDEKNTLSADLQYLFVVMPILFLAQLALSEWVWRKQRKLSHKHVGRPLAAVFFLSFMSSHLIYMWSDAYFYNPVTNQKSNFPLSYPMTAKSFMEKHGLLDRDEYRRRLEANAGSQDLVLYPLEPIEFSRRSSDLNILIVNVNNWRADSMTESVMPHTYQFAQDNSYFTQHYSSSNNMLGMFGLFYGLPSSYANSMKSQGTAPLFLSLLKDNDYNVGLFSGDNFDDNLYDEIIFRHELSELDRDTASSFDDKQAIEQWSQWVKNEGTSPWFSFLALTTVDHYNDYSDKSTSKTASERLKESYLSSVNAADLELQNLYQHLIELELLDKTIVVVTSNHGSEFNETKTNSWGSNTNYSHYQLQVPMIIHWPGKQPATYKHQSSHLDLSVTLLQDMLGVSSKASNYSSGKNLFDERRRKWVFAGDNRELALITTKETTVIDKFGNYKLYDHDYKRLKDRNPKLPVLMQGLTELQRFYIKDE